MRKYTVLRENERSYEKECEQRAVELGLLTQFITFDKHRMLCAKMACVCGSLFILTFSVFHDFVLSGPRLSHC